MFIKGLLMELAMGAVAVLPGILLFYCVMLKKDKEQEQDKDKGKPVILHIGAVMALYLEILAIFCLTGIPSLYSLHPDVTVNWIPLTDLLDSPLMYIQNILLFVPLGFLLPMLWKPFEAKRLTFAWGFLLSLFIELMQLFNFRFTDIDDLLANTLGTILGYFLYMWLKEAVPALKTCSIEDKGHWRWEPYAVFGLTWLSMFLIRPLIGLVIYG